MIQTKDDLKRYMDKDRKAYAKKGKMSLKEKVIYSQS